MLLPRLLLSEFESNVALELCVELGDELCDEVDFELDANELSTPEPMLLMVDSEVIVATVED